MMKIKNPCCSSIWIKEGKKKHIQIIDQRYLPFDYVVKDLKSVESINTAIKDMWLRGAPLIGVAAGFGIYFAAATCPAAMDIDKQIIAVARRLKLSRPTAINLEYAVNRVMKAIKQGKTRRDKIEIAYQTACAIMDEETESCRKIGIYGLPLIEEMSLKKKGKPVHILTHCNAGWLACVKYGTATSSIYFAHDKGIKIHVWVDETRPRNQGARLTAWELNQAKIPHTVIPDNTGGHLMQNGMVDMVIVGSDRTTSNGDVANKIGTYLKALSAKDNGVPFYVALPFSSIDMKITDGQKQIPVEQRHEDEVKYIEGLKNNKIQSVLLTHPTSPAANYAFDITPARLVTALITERGICKADKKSILRLQSKKNIRKI